MRYARTVTPPIVLASAALLLAGWALPAAADEEPAPALGFTVGARVSAAFPMGSVSTDPGTGAPLIDEFVAVSIPVQLDLGLTLHRRWFVGTYVQYAWNVLQLGECEKGQSCSVTGLHVGIQATYAFRDHGGPWLGLGTGWEWMFTSYSGPNFDTRLDVAGWEYAIFQAGWDVAVSPGWMVGPWISGSVGEFSRASLKTGGRSSDTAIPNRAVHGWLQLGVKGSFSL
ncbi:MAG: LigA [Anaeromyxobacteraceae bacterium]|nr:LigA [Anaeromyxobacteraceae bacterium]